MESFLEAASKETCYSLYLRNFYTIILAIKFYYDGKKEHLFRRISVTIKKTLEENSEKITKQKKQLLLQNVVYC